MYRSSSIFLTQTGTMPTGIHTQLPSHLSKIETLGLMYAKTMPAISHLPSQSYWSFPSQGYVYLDTSRWVSGDLYTLSRIQKPDIYPRLISVTITTNNYIPSPYSHHPLHKYCKQPYFVHMLISTTVIHTRHLKQTHVSDHTHIFSCTTTPTASTSQHVSSMNVLHLPYWHVHVIHAYICYPETSMTIIVSYLVNGMHWSACYRLFGCTIGSRILSIPLYISQFIQWLYLHIPTPQTYSDIICIQV